MENTTNIFLSLLTVLFIGLKLTHTISWSWWAVLSPIWIPLVVVFAALIVAFVVHKLISDDCDDDNDDL